MSDEFLDVQVQLYPELLRRMAAGEKLSTAPDKDDAEKLAASLLVAEAIEAEKAAEDAPVNVYEKKAVVGTAILAGAAGMALKDPLKKMISAMRGTTQLPEDVGMLAKKFEQIVEEQQKTQAAKRKVVGAALGGAAVGALSTKALEEKKHEAVEKAVSTERRREKASGDETAETEKIEGSPTARAVLDKLLKNFV